MSPTADLLGDTQSTAARALFTEADVTRIAQEAVRRALEAREQATTQPYTSSVEAGTTARPEVEVKDSEMDRRRQRQAIRESRVSVSNLASEAVNMTFNEQPTYYTSSPLSPFRPRPPAQTRAAFERRLSGGYPDGVSAPLASDAADVVSPVEVPKTAAERRKQLESISRTLGKAVEKFYGERARDGEITVHEFVEVVNTQMDNWLGEEEQLGRLTLVISCTGGTAQMWLIRKMQEMKKLHAAGVVTDRLLMEWSEVQDDFIHEMSKGITSAVYELQLKALRIRDRDGRMDVDTFRRRFDQICTRLYPYASFTNDRDRRRRLGEKFEERLRYCGEGPKLRDDCLKMLIARRISERERMVEDWQEVLLEVASTDEWLNARTGAAAKEKGQQKTQSTWSHNKQVSAMAAPQ
jgi:hypothetical protein